jgi:aminoglycoside phosphotransferase (APT) family kinase protein
VRLPDSVTDNLHFLCVEVDSQLDNLQAYAADPNPALAQRIADRSGYAFNLKTRIHNGALERLANCKEGGPEALALRGVELVATNLEKIAVLCRDSVKQMRRISNRRYLDADTYASMLKRVRRATALAEPAIRENDTRLALKISQIKDKLDRDCADLMDHYTDSLKRRKDTEDLIHALFVAHGIEQMGEALLDISESIVSANLGQPVNMERYRALRASVQGLDAGRASASLQIEPIAETRSGSAISGIAAGNGRRNGYAAVFKEGQKRKLKEERQGVENWHEIYPGLAPRILSYKKRGQSAALLIEHLPGQTFEQILLNESSSLVDETLEHLVATLISVWQETRTEVPVSADFMRQLQKRLPDVYKIHPEFQQDGCRLCGADIAAFDSLLERAREYEAGLPAPFSVYIHGDFNLDNIIYDPIEQRINFIDLHRSQYMDYVQDVSVFMVSNYRLQILDAPHRRRILGLATAFYRMVRQFADDVGDESFDMRLAFGLARSFATSTRFILDKSLAKKMILRARYLIELLLRDAARNRRFRIPIQEIFVG